MLFEEKTITLKNGKSCILRPAAPREAGEMIDYLKTVSGETEFLLRNPDEITLTLDDERAFLWKITDSPNGFMMIAEVEGESAGTCSLTSKGNAARRMKHRCGFSIALKKQYWRLGIAAAMTDYAMELAQSIGYEQAELEVVEGNIAAKTLYEKFGFEVTGKNPRALKYDDGSYRDEYVMVKMFKPLL